MKKRLIKKLAKQAVSELKTMKSIGPLSSKRIQLATWNFLFHNPGHPISEKFWDLFNRLDLKVKE